MVVGPRESLHAHWMSLRNVNWLGDAPLAEEGLEVAVRIRSSAPPQPATLFPAEGGKANVLLRDGEYGIAAGQACVFYADTSPRARVLGGGWIERALSRSQGLEAGGIRAGGKMRGRAQSFEELSSRESRNHEVDVAFGGAAGAKGPQALQGPGDKQMDEAAVRIAYRAGPGLRQHLRLASWPRAASTRSRSSTGARAACWRSASARACRSPPMRATWRSWASTCRPRCWRKARERVAV